MIQYPLKPRNGHVLHVGIMARISGCQNQKELSLDDQIDHAKAEAMERFKGEIKYYPIASKGKGERLDRPELEEVETLIRSKLLDVLIVEDIGRMVRGTEAVRLCGLAVDHGVRVIAPNDCIDTADGSWEEDVISACRDHVGHNAHTSKRLKQKMMNRFLKLGASMARPVYGYIVPKEAKTYDDWLKDEMATPILLELCRRYLLTPNFSLLADWLNEQGIPTGPYDRTKKWNSTKVRRLLANSLLKGMPCRGRRHTVKHHETGRRISVNKPDGPVFYACPHLVHVPVELWEEVNNLRAQRNGRLGRKKRNGNDPRVGVTRKRTIFPGQHIRCGICGRLFYWGGHGKNNHMMCSGTHNYECWNAMTFEGELASRRILEALIAKLEQLPEFDVALLERLNSQVESVRARNNLEQTNAERDLQEVERKIDNLGDAISQKGLDDVLGPKLMQLKMDRLKLQQHVRELKLTEKDDVVLPPMTNIKQRLREAIRDLPTDSPGFGELMKRIITDLVVLPHRICDGNRIVQRAKFVVTLVPLINTSGVPVEVETLLRHEVVVDLFDPPQRVQLYNQIMSLFQNDASLGEIAESLGITKVAVQNALKLPRKMKQLGLTDPWIPLTEPPADDTKLKRHLHPRYHFKPFKSEEAD